MKLLCCLLSIFGATLFFLSGMLGFIRQTHSTAYSLAFRGGQELHTMNPDGSNLRRITNMKGIEQNPAWSSDGRWIAFVSHRTFLDGDKEIYRMRPSGKSLERLTENYGWDIYPAWSPDNRKIAFLSDEVLLYLHVLDLESKVVFRFDQVFSVRDIAWSPNGEWLILLAGNGQTYRLRPDGSAVNRFLDRSYHFITSNIVWSPDGEWLVFSEKDGLLTQVYRVRADGTQQEALTSDAAQHVSPIWSPNGKHIAYIKLANMTQDVILMEHDGQNPQQLTQGFTWIERVVWSPDGNWLYFIGIMQSIPQSPQIFRVSVDGQDMEQLTYTSNELETPAISPLIDLPLRMWRLMLIGCSLTILPLGLSELPFIRN